MGNDCISKIKTEIEHIKRYIKKAKQHNSIDQDRYYAKLDLIGWLEEYIQYKDIGITPGQIKEMSDMYKDLAKAFNKKNEEIVKLEDKVRFLQGSRGWTPLKKAEPEAYKSYWCTVIDATGCIDTLMLYYTGVTWLVDCDGGEYDGQVVAWSRLLKQYTIAIYK